MAANNANDLLRLEDITTTIARIISEPINHNDPEQVTFKIAEFGALLGTSTEAVSLAEMVYNEALGLLAEQYVTTKIMATDKAMIFKGRLKKELYYVTLTDRQNKSLTHQIEGLRSIISFLKSEMQNLPRN